MNREQNATELRRLRTSEALVGGATFSRASTFFGSGNTLFGEYMAKEQHCKNSELALG